MSDAAPTTIVAGVGLALLAAVLYAVGVALQAAEAHEAPDEEALHLTLLRRLVRRPRWLAGSGCVLGGWLAQAGALSLAPISIVQPALALSVVCLLFVAARWFGERATRREGIAAAAIVLGVAGLVLVAPPAGEEPASALPLAVGLSVIGAGALLPFAMRGHHRFGATVAIGAGLAYAWVAFGTAFLTDAAGGGAWVIAGLWLGGAAAAAVFGLVAEMTALQHHSAISVFPIVLVVQVLVAVLLAPLLASEPWPMEPGVLALLAGSLGLVLIGTVRLASSDTVGAVVAAAANGDGASARA